MALSVLSSRVGHVKQWLRAASRWVQSSAVGQATLGAAWHPSDIPVWAEITSTV